MYVCVLQQKGGKVTTLPAHINEVVCPWWQRPYKDQLVDKYNKVKTALEHVTQEVSRAVLCCAVQWRHALELNRVQYVSAKNWHRMLSPLTTTGDISMCVDALGVLAGC